MRFFLTSLFLLLCCTGKAQTDTLSYAAGNHITQSILSEDTTFNLRDEVQAREYIRGLEENMPEVMLSPDSTFRINYAIGAMQGVFLSDGIVHKSEGKRPPLDCIMSGLRMVAEQKLTLPDDSIAAREYMQSLPETTDPLDLPEDEKCRYFTAWGIAYGLACDVQDYINTFSDQHVAPNRNYFAQGMADALALCIEPSSAFDLGRSAGLIFYLSLLDVQDTPASISKSDYIDGAKAALGLAEAKLTEQEIESCIGRMMGGDITENHKDDISGIRATPGEPIDVCWQFEAFAPAMAADAPAEVIEAMERAVSYLQDVGIVSVPLDECELLYFPYSDSPMEDHWLRDTMTEAENRVGQLPEGYRFVYGEYGEPATLFGIVETNSSFKSNVVNAVLNLLVYEDGDIPYTEVSFHFGDKSNCQQKARGWETFTQSNIGKTIVVIMNGEIVSAPRINSPITSGACSLTNLPAATINKLLE